MWIRSLVRELRFHMLHSMAPKFKKKIKLIKFELSCSVTLPTVLGLRNHRISSTQRVC